MIAEYRHALGRLRGRIIGWGISLALYGLMMALLYDDVSGMAGFEEMLASYPEEMMAFFGGADIVSITTPQGYLDIYFFTYMTVIIGIFIVAAAPGLFAGDEERGLLDLVMAHPISRSGLFLGRVLALVTATILILFISWLSWYLPGRTTTLDLSGIELFRPFVPLFVELLLFGSLALLLSLLLPSSRAAAMLTAALLVGNFLLLGMAELNESLKSLVEYTPLYYDQGGDAIAGIDWPPVFGLLAFTLLFTAGAWWRFRQRDIRVGGERSWSWRVFRRGRQPAA